MQTRVLVFSLFVFLFVVTICGQDKTAADKSGELPKPDIADGTYGPYQASTFDLWKAKSKKPTPLMIYIHGGGLAAGEKSNINFNRVKALLDAGISVMSINYRLTGEAIFPEHYMDCARAIQYARFNAKDLHIDPKLIGALGGSAGGMTSLWIGFHDDMADRKNADPLLRESTRLRVVAPFDAQTTLVPDVVAKYVGVLAIQYQNYYDGRVFGISKEEAMSPKAIDLYKQISPLTYLTKDDPPVWAVYDLPDKPLTAESNAEYAIHHPGFGKVLKEEMDKLKIECKLVQREVGQNVNGDMVAFLSKYLQN
jgi:acetyl esterase